MVVRFILISLAAWMMAFSSQAYAQAKDKVYIVSLDVSSPKDISVCYTQKCDVKKVKVEFAFEDTINYLHDFIYEEEPMYGPDCFVPELKLIFRYYTYVISLYCTSAVKYKNLAPFQASNVRMKNDLIFTPSVYDYLTEINSKYFGNKRARKTLISQVVSSEPLEDPNDDVEELTDMLLGEDEAEAAEEDQDMEQESDDEEMFEDVEIPDEDMEIPDDDDDLNY